MSAFVAFHRVPSPDCSGVTAHSFILLSIWLQAGAIPNCCCYCCCCCLTQLSTTDSAAAYDPVGSGGPDGNGGRACGADLALFLLLLSLNTESGAIAPVVLVLVVVSLDLLLGLVSYSQGIPGEFPDIPCIPPFFKEPSSLFLFMIEERLQDSKLLIQSHISSWGTVCPTV